MKVTIDEILDTLSDAWECPESCRILSDRIKAHGIEQPSIDALIAEIDALPLLYNDQCYSAVAIKSITDKYRGKK